jgi:hypothetical protein
MTTANPSPYQRRVWHKGEERLLKQWGEMCNAYSWLHEQAQQRIGNLSYATLIPILIMNATAASLAFMASETKSLETSAGIVNIVAGALVVFERTLQFQETKEKHRECSALFAKVGRMIQSELSMPKTHRLMDGNDFLRLISFDVDRIIQMNVLIPQTVLRKFKRQFEKNKFAKPDDLFEIFISNASSPENDETQKSSSRTSSDACRQNIIVMKHHLDAMLQSPMPIEEEEMEDASSE